jgi:NAD(P)H-dependent FMN reductase
VLTGKPILLMGASTSQTGGTVQAQSQLRISLAVLGAEVVPTPPVLITDAKQRLADDGHLDDEVGQFLLSMALDRFADLVDRVRAANEKKDET